MGNVWLIASGKGGVGKSTITSNLGIALAQAGKRVCLIDADIGLRDLDLILGLADLIVYDLLDVTNQGCALSQALISPPGLEKLSLLAASQFARSKDLNPKAFSSVIQTLSEANDFVLVDCPAGIERGFRTLLHCHPTDIMLVLTNDDVCIRDAERVVGLLSEKDLPRPKLVCNRLSAELIRSGEMMSAAAIASSLEVDLLGEVPEDVMVTRSLLRHLSLMDVDCEARKAILRIAMRMQGQSVPPAAYGSEKTSFLHKFFKTKLKEVRLIDR